MQSATLRRNVLLAVLMGAIALLGAVTVAPATTNAGTRVPGHDSNRYDQDGNGIPDAGVYVVGAYTALYAYDESGA